MLSCAIHRHKCRECHNTCTVCHAYACTASIQPEPGPVGNIIFRPIPVHWFLTWPILRILKCRISVAFIQVKGLTISLLNEWMNVRMNEWQPSFLLHKTLQRVSEWVRVNLTHHRSFRRRSSWQSLAQAQMLNSSSNVKLWTRRGSVWLGAALWFCLAWIVDHFTESPSRLWSDCRPTYGGDTVKTTCPRNLPKFLDCVSPPLV